MKRIALAALAAISMVGAAEAETYFSGWMARAACSESADWCLGFVGAAQDAFTNMHFISELDGRADQVQFCVPDRTPLTELVREYLDYLDRQPSKAMDGSATALLYLALSNRHPCA